MKAFGTLALGATLILAPVAASAGSITIPLNATATVAANCKINTPGSLNLGNYDPIVANSTTPLTASTTVSANCTKGSALTLAINSAPLSSVWFADKLPVTLLPDSTTPLTQIGLGVSTPNTLIVNATIAPGLDVPVTIYKDYGGGDNVVFNF